MHNKYLPELAAVISAGPIVVYTCEAFGEFAVTSITPNVFEQLGYEPEEFLSASGFWASNIHPDDSPGIFENLGNLFEKGFHSHEYRFRHKDGTHRWMHDDLRLIVDGEGRPQTIVGYWADITKYKGAEYERRESEARFRDFTESASDWFWEQDAEFRFTKVSSFKENRFLNRTKDAIGHTRWGFMGVNPEEDEHWRRHVDDLSAHRSFRGFRYNATDADGKEHAFSVNGKPIFSENGTFTGYRGTVADVTELAEATSSNERFLHALEHLSEGLALWDVEGRLEICNEVLRNTAGTAGLELRRGITYKEWLRAHLRHRMIPEAMGREEAWLAERMAYFENPVGAFEVHRNGRWYLFRLQRLPDGSTLHSAFDIHDMKQSEQRFKDFSGVASDWFWETDGNDRFSYFSDQFEDITGINPDTLLGKSRAETRPQGIGDDAWDALLEKIASHREFRNVIFSRLRPNGEDIWMSISGMRKFDKDGNFVGYRGTGTDISKEIEATNKTQRVERQLYNAIEVMEDGLVLFDAEDRMVICNQKYRDLYYEIAETLVPGATFTEIINAVVESNQIFRSPEDMESWPAERMERHLNPTGPFDQRLSRGNWVRILEQKTAEGGIVSLSTDITREKHEQEELRKLSHALEQSPSMVFITDAKGNIEYVNSMFTKISGYTADEAIGENPRILKSGNIPVAIYTGLWQTVISGREWRGELQDRRKDGSMFWAYATISPVKNDAGDITHFVSMHEDITERKQIEFFESRARRQAEMANRAKSEILANMSHELRTPLNAIIGFSQMFQDRTFGPLGHEKYDEYAADISISGQHLLTLINDILDVSAIEAGKLELNEEYIDVARIVESSVRMVSNRAEDSGIHLRVDIADGVSGLYADKRRIKQILLNLLSNAIKFTEPGGEISVEAMVAAAGDIIFRVTDTGIGMNELELAKAMEQFGQVDSSHARKYEGSGLGLPLTVGLVALHNGVFNIESEKGEGTAVTISFPQERAAT